MAADHGPGRVRRRGAGHGATAGTIADPVILARGEYDAMNTSEQLARLGVPAVTLPGLGHNAHVESPELSITLLDPYR